MTRQEAKELTIKNTQDTLMLIIEQAAKHGQYYCFIDLTTNEKEKLKYLGYTVKRGSGAATCIKWD